MADASSVSGADKVSVSQYDSGTSSWITRDATVDQIAAAVVRNLVTGAALLSSVTASSDVDADAEVVIYSSAGASQRVSLAVFKAMLLSGALAVDLTALTGGQGSALVLTAEVNLITTAPSGGGVKLRATTGSTRRKVLNRGSNDLSVYPDTGEAIYGLSANAAVTVSPGATVTFNYDGSGTWIYE